jgi:hypothetical protein
MPGYYGSGAITGKQNLLDYASQSYTSGAGDVMTGGNDSAFIDLNPESVRLTQFGRTNGPMAQAVRESKGQALDLYFQQLSAEKQAAEEEKAKKKAFRNAIKMAIISSAVGAIGGSMASGAQAGVSSLGKDATFLQKLGAGFKGTISGGKINGVQVGGLSNLFSGNFALSQIGNAKQLDAYMYGNGEQSPFYSAVRGYSGPSTPLYKQLTNIPQDLSNFQQTLNSGVTGDYNIDQYNLPNDPTELSDLAQRTINLRSNASSLLMVKYNLSADQARSIVSTSSSRDLMNLLSKSSTIENRATGGSIPSRAGIDTVPAMLSGGEFIMNAGATQRIGANNLNAMNSGASTGSDSSAINDQLIKKLDELIQTTKESSKAITVNVASTGGQATGEDTTSEQSKQDQNLSRKIKAAVVQVLQEEKRLGGVLRRA